MLIGSLRGSCQRMPSGLEISPRLARGIDSSSCVHGRRVHLGWGRLRSLLGLALLAPMMLVACGGTSGVRRPSRSERAEIVAAINRLGSGWAGRPFAPCCVSGRLRAELARRFPGLVHEHDYSRVVDIRVSERDPRLAVAAVEVFNASGGPTHQASVMMLDEQRPLEHGEPRWVANAGPASCPGLLTGAVRELLCPSPWSVLHYSAGEAQAKASSVGTIAPRWSEVALPGSVCGTTTPIHLHWSGKYGQAFVRSSYWPWLPAVVGSSRPTSPT